MPGTLDASWPPDDGTPEEDSEGSRTPGTLSTAWPGTEGMTDADAEGGRLTTGAPAAEPPCCVMEL